MRNEILDKLLLKNDDKLWDHQNAARHEIYSRWKENRSLMLQMPTGTGKTRLFVSIILDFIDNEMSKIFVIAHRTELVNQIEDELKHQCQETYERALNNVVIMSARKISNRYNTSNADLIIVDEAHHAKASSYQYVLKRATNAKILGVTATPVRLSGEGFTDLFDDIIISPPVKYFINKKILCGYKYYSVSRSSKEYYNLTYLNRSAYNDYSIESMLQYFNKENIRTNILKMYKKYALGKKGIVYTINRRHNIDLTRRFIENGISARFIDSDTPEEKRQEIVQQFRKGVFDVLFNVNIFTEGFDCPDVDFIMLARPTLSMGLYLQQVGRGMRNIDGKKPLIILDAVGLYLKFGLPDKERNWKILFLGYEHSGYSKSDFYNKNTRGQRYDFTESDEETTLINISGEENEKEIPTNSKKWRKLGILYNKFLKTAKKVYKPYIVERSIPKTIKYKATLGYNIFGPLETIYCNYKPVLIAELMRHERIPFIQNTQLEYRKFESHEEYTQYKMTIMRNCFNDAYLEKCSELIEEMKQYTILDILTYVGYKYGKSNVFYNKIFSIAMYHNVDDLNASNFFTNNLLKSVCTQNSKK